MYVQPFPSARLAMLFVELKKNGSALSSCREAPSEGLCTVDSISTASTGAPVTSPRNAKAKSAATEGAKSLRLQGILAREEPCSTKMKVKVVADSHSESSCCDTIALHCTLSTSTPVQNAPETSHVAVRHVITDLRRTPSPSHETYWVWYMSAALVLKHLCGVLHA